MIICLINFSDLAKEERQKLEHQVSQQSFIVDKITHIHACMHTHAQIHV